jgi:hypothetical protein
VQASTVVADGAVEPVLYLKQRTLRIATNPRAVALETDGKAIDTQPVSARDASFAANATDLNASIAWRFEDKPARNFVSVSVGDENVALI